MSIHKQNLLDETNITADTNSVSQRLRWIERLAVQVITSAVNIPVGAQVKLQASNDDTNWSDIAGTTTSITAAGNFTINVTDIGYKYVRARFEITSGDITSKAVLTGHEKVRI